MRIWKSARLGAIPVLLIGAGIAFASSGGAPRSRTGAPAIASIGAEGTCLGCHNNFSLNNGVTVSFVDPPATYMAGATYTFSVQVASTATAGNANRVWSFELTAVNMTDGTGAGTFSNVSGQGTQIINGSGSYSTRQYIQSSTDRPGATSPVQWQVKWTAPAVAPGQIGFYTTGIAGDGSGNTSGDRVGKAALVVDQTATPVASSTWGKVKAAYR